MRSRLSATVFGVAVSTLMLVQCGGPRVPGGALAPAPDGAWPMYRHDLAATGHSPLAEITPSNVASLTQVWTHALAGEQEQPSNSQATPIVVDGVMYLPAADRVVALEPETGQEIWRHVLADGAPSRRGVSYWPGDDTTAPRIIVTAGERLLALDAATGAAVESFGQGGVQDMGVPYNSVPLVYRDVVVVGANTPRGAPGGIGNARAFSARTGAKVWEFSSVPQPGEPGHDSWEGDSWRDRLGVNAWPFYFSMDEDRGLLYLPLASPIPADYGGDRPGDNLYGNSVVAVDVETGAYRWHFQTIRHDLWDADPPAPPTLFDIPRDGGTIPALGVTTKSGYLYILNRETGEPVYGVEDVSVAASDVPGEQAASTQPVPVKPTGAGTPRLHASRPGNRRGHVARTRRGVPRPRGVSRRALQRRSVHAVGLSRRRGAAPDHDLIPWRSRRRELGWTVVRSHHGLRVRGDARPRSARVDGTGARGSTGAVHQERSPPVVLHGPD